MPNRKKISARTLLTTSVFTALTLTMGCELQDNAAKSADNSGRAANNSTELLDLSQNGYGDSRQGGARERRVEAIETMTKAKTVDAKSVSAAAFFSAMEFQTWKSGGFREDTADKRDALMTEAVSEFLKVAKDFLPSEINYDGKMDVDGNAIALSLAMHRVSLRQVEASARYNFEAKSMMHLLSEALQKKAQLEMDPSAASALKPYVFEALRESGEVVTFFRLRMNAMTASAAGILLSGFKRDQMSSITGFKLDPVQLEDARLRIAEAVRLKKFLTAVGIETKLFADLKAGIWGAGESNHGIASGIEKLLQDPAALTYMAKSLKEIKAYLDILTPTP